MSHYTGTWAAFCCKNGPSCWQWLCFLAFFCLFYSLSLLRGTYLLTYFCYIPNVQYVFTEWLTMVLLSTLEGLYTVLEICPINITVFPFRCIPWIFAISQQTPLSVTAVPSLIWFWCTTCHGGVIIFHSCESTLMKSAQVLSLGGFPGKTFWLPAIFHLEMFAGWIQLVSLETSCL